MGSDFIVGRVTIVKYLPASHSSRSLFGRNVVFCAQRFNCSINDLPIIINSYVRNSVDETTLHRVAFLMELILIRDSSLTSSVDLIYQACFLAAS